MSLLKDLMVRAMTEKASDIHLKPHQKPFFRVDGEIREAGTEDLTPDMLWAMVREVLPPHLAKRFEDEHDCDFSFFDEKIGRFRVNLFLSQNVPVFAMRNVKDRVPSFEELSLPLTLRDLTGALRGIIIISGPTGSGKSTTLAAMIEHLNQTQRCRMITVEDPIEYQFTDKRSVISQREVGLDTLTFHSALKHVIRQDPDVIVIGEMRDEVSFRVAISAAETGHLVFTTMHAGTAALAVQRSLEFFPTEERDQVRMGLAGNLHAVVCQRLSNFRKSVFPQYQDGDSNDQ